MNRYLLLIIATGGVAAMLATAGCDSDVGADFRLGTAPPSDMGVRPPSGFDSVQPTAEPDEIVEVRITNSDGSISTVRLRRRGPSYIGPRGEYYSELPTEAQLQPVYGF